MNVIINVKSGLTKERMNEFLAEVRAIKHRGFQDVVNTISLDTMNIIDLGFDDGVLDYGDVNIPCDLSRNGKLDFVCPKCGATAWIILAIVGNDYVNECPDCHVPMNRVYDGDYKKGGNGSKDA